MNLINLFQKTIVDIGMKTVESSVFYKASIGIRFEIGGEDDDVYRKKGISRKLYPNPDYVNKAVADRVVIIGRGKLLADMTIEEMNKKSLSSHVYVEADDSEKMAKVLRKNHAIVQKRNNGLEVRNLKTKEIGQLAYDNQIVLYELKKVQPTLEELFTEITYGKVDYVSQGVDIK